MNKAFTVRHIFQDAAEAVGNGTPLDVTGLARLGIQVSYAAADSASASPSASESVSVSPSASASGSESPSGSKSPSASASPSLSPSASSSPSASQSISPSVSPSVSPSTSVSPSASPSAPPSGQSGDVFFECTVDGLAWYELPVTPIEGGAVVTVTSAPGLWAVVVAGLGQVRCRLGGTVLGAVTVLGVGT